MSSAVHIVGAGLAGAEAAWQVAERGLEVVLHEMRPGKLTPAHQGGDFAELVCSNSFKSQNLSNASGLLKEELRRLDSLIMKAAAVAALPAGQALAVDRELFATQVTEQLRSHPRVTVVAEEVTTLPQQGNEPWVIATGPLTSPALATSLQELAGEPYLYFYDASAPIVTYESLNTEKVFAASRYDKGEADYLNAPLDEAEYLHFWQELVSAEQHPRHSFEEARFFEGCIPLEEMARRGRETLAYGPLKPVGLRDPRSARRPYAVVQLRQDNLRGDLYSLVGFQTNLRFGEQERVFRLIPGLEEAEFVRFGVMHQNLFINSPALLLPTLQLKGAPHLLFAGQMIGVEGYIESAATGWLAGYNAACLAKGVTPRILPEETMLGALVHYVTSAEITGFQPMNAVFGIMPVLINSIPKISKKLRNQLYAERSLETLANWVKNV